MIKIIKCPECEHWHIEGCLFRIGNPTRYSFSMWWAMWLPKKYTFPPFGYAGVSNKSIQCDLLKSAFPPDGIYGYSFVIGPFEFSWPHRPYLELRKRHNGH